MCAADKKGRIKVTSLEPILLGAARVIWSDPIAITWAALTNYLKSFLRLLTWPYACLY
jgi:hypothetical protein